MQESAKPGGCFLRTKMKPLGKALGSVFAKDLTSVNGPVNGRVGQQVWEGSVFLEVLNAGCEASVDNDV